MFKPILGIPISRTSFFETNRNIYSNHVFCCSQRSSMGCFPPKTTGPPSCELRGCLWARSHRSPATWSKPWWSPWSIGPVWRLDQQKKTQRFFAQVLFNSYNLNFLKKLSSLSWMIICFSLYRRLWQLRTLLILRVGLHMLLKGWVLQERQILGKRPKAPKVHSGG